MSRPEMTQSTPQLPIHELLDDVIKKITIKTSDTELILKTYIVTPTSTGGPAISPD